MLSYNKSVIVCVIIERYGTCKEQIPDSQEQRQFKTNINHLSIDWFKTFNGAMFKANPVIRFSFSNKTQNNGIIRQQAILLHCQ